MDANALQALKDAALRERYETTRCGMAVIISGLLESLLRDVAEAFIREVNSRNRPFNALPERIRFAHFIHGAEQLREIARREKGVKKPPRLTAGAEQIARRLASPGTPPYELIWEAFADTQSNPGPGALADYLRRFDIDDPLAKLGPKTRGTYSKTTIEVLLGNFITLRNECAHTGGATVVPQTTYLRDTCDFIDDLAEAIVRLWS